MDREEKKRAKKESRRFSKTIATNFSNKNKSQIENMVFKKYNKMAIDCSNGSLVDPKSDCMTNFNEYFESNAYNAYSVDKNVNRNSLFFTMMYVYHKLEWAKIIPGLNEQKYMSMSFRLQMSYRENPYHSQIHAGDVVNSIYQMIFSCDTKNVCSLSDLDIFFTILSGAAHDMDHPGNTNMYETKTQSKLAILYNDVSVLENHHAASFFFMLDNNNHDCNPMLGFDKKVVADGRKMILENILCTDMTKHGEI